MGVLCAGLMFSLVVYMILSKANESVCVTFFDYVDDVSGKYSGIVRKFMLIYMFTGFFVMLSAGGSLFSYNFGYDKKIGILIMTIICFLVFVYEAKGLAVLNMILVPIMIIGIIYTCFSSYFNAYAAAFLPLDSLKKNIYLSAICYVSYNTINAGAVLVPCSLELNEKEIKKSAILSGTLLFILILLVWLSQNISFESIYYSDFPMLDIALKQGEIQKTLYSVILFMAIITTAASSGYGIISNINFKRKSEKLFFTIVMCLLAAPLSCLGFSYLVSNLYTLFGYVGIIWLIMIFKNFIS